MRGACEGQNQRFGPYAANATPFVSDRPMTGDVWKVTEFVVLSVGSGSSRMNPHLPEDGGGGVGVAGSRWRFSHVTRAHTHSHAEPSAAAPRLRSAVRRGADLPGMW